VRLYLQYVIAFAEYTHRFSIYNWAHCRDHGNYVCFRQRCMVSRYRLLPFSFSHPSPARFLIPLPGSLFFGTAPSLAMEANEQVPYCLPGCTCTRKLSSPPGTTQALTGRSSDIGSQSSAESRPRSLVQLPDEYQRRCSIIVAFEV
jgi:hypothetical protein